mmetsp:Transcript_7274/g.30262  ORF Transcript_7274/g.30262 Transcript_7274/m.30262 type:complete len:249 (-) Transcript_7274:3314-4060(-)
MLSRRGRRKCAERRVEREDATFVKCKKPFQFPLFVSASRSGSTSTTTAPGSSLDSTFRTTPGTASTPRSCVSQNARTVSVTRSGSVDRISMKTAKRPAAPSGNETFTVPSVSSSRARAAAVTCATVLRGTRSAMHQRSTKRGRSPCWSPSRTSSASDRPSGTVTGMVKITGRRARVTSVALTSATRLSMNASGISCRPAKTRAMSCRSSPSRTASTPYAPLGTTTGTAATSLVRAASARLSSLEGVPG